MFTKFSRILIITIALVPALFNIALGQDNRTLESLKTTAEYGEGQRRTDAQFELGYRYYTGTKGATQDYEKSAKWFLPCAEKGSLPAMFNLYLCYSANSRIKDSATAIKWLTQAADAHYSPATIIAGKRYYYGDGVSQDYRKAAQYFKDAAFQENGEGMYYYSWIHAYGQGVQKDSTKTVLWAKRGINSGDNNCKTLLGKIYYEGQAVKKNYSEAFAYYREGDAENISNCSVGLGNMYKNGEFVDVNLPKAIECFTKAANQNNLDGIAGLIYIFAAESSDCYNLDMAIYWIKKHIAAGGTTFKQYLPTYLAEAGRYSEAEQYYKTEAEKGSASAYNSWAYLYVNGKLGAVDYSMALSLIEKAIALEPNNPNFQDSKGEILMKKGDTKGARRVWTIINKNYPSYYADYIKRTGEDTELNTYMKANAQ